MLSVVLTCRRPLFDVTAAFDVQPGELLGLFGPSGAGKSTLLEAAAGLLIPLSGTVALDGRVLTQAGPRRRIFVPPWQRHIGLVRQDATGFPHLRVAANLTYGLPGQRLDGATRALAGFFGIAGVLDRRMVQLSGGERRRVALVQTLAAHPRALLLDEPFAALDAPVRTEMSARVHDILCQQGLPAVLVSHDLTDLQRWCDRIAVLIAGKVHQIASPADLVTNPASWEVAQLAGYSRQLPGDLIGRPGTVVAIHPDRVRLGAFPLLGPVLGARVRRCVPRGVTWLVEACAGDATIEMTLPSDAEPPEPGQEVMLTLLAPPTFLVERGAAVTSLHPIVGDKTAPITAIR